ncbi:MAG: nuclear transport factor 2 family protein [Candidatus Dormibacteraeota bacterium]|nr:nuclear transport factor 2 family protein [Candidatus Dormibacteraeota bacterium]MBO0704510.1 nuclear transport factor 2 family protein [Candidatus Dormibacteraeota bacterium]MBO0761742.1 nuclear transport factor 2 family protein [Candidatus Dormibacteraeota bacterium]
MQESIAGLVERVGRLEDLEAIRRTWHDYFFALDSSDWDGLAGLFTEDATLHLVGFDDVQLEGGTTYRGRRSIVEEFFVPRMGATAASERGLHYTGHHGTNMQIDLAGDEATTLAYFFEILANTSVRIGTYQHRFHRDPDRWRMAFLRISIRYRAQIEATHVGGMGLADVRALPV